MSGDEAKRGRRDLSNIVDGERSKVYEGFDFINNGTVKIETEILPTVEVSIETRNADEVKLDFSWKLVNFTQNLMVF